MKAYDIVIGLETHVQLKTNSKMFCSTSAVYFNEKPNSHTCPVCLGLPGALPVTNKKAIESAIKIGLALNCKINLKSYFERKNYFYPDLAKGYQISQFQLPISYHGFLTVQGKKIRINRAHMEEDTGKLTHVKLNKEAVSLVDFNRSGVPLLEIVTEPDLSSPEEAKAYAKSLHRLLRYLDLADADMEKAGMRFDANISLKPKGQKELGTKVEIKNINSFGFLEKALFFEIARQLKALEIGEKIVQETRGWDETSGTTKSQRQKETSPDYRYFPEPDLPEVSFSKKEIEELRLSLPELPTTKEERFEKNFGLSSYDVRLITSEPAAADWFEKAVADYQKIYPQVSATLASKVVANWQNGEINRLLKESRKDFTQVPFEPAALAQLLLSIDKGIITQSVAKQVLGRMFSTGELPNKIIEEESLSVIGSGGELTSLIETVLKENEKAVSDYKKGKEESLGFLLGQVMKAAKGKADPAETSKILREKLS